MEPEPLSRGQVLDGRDASGLGPQKARRPPQDARPPRRPEGSRPVALVKEHEATAAEPRSDDTVDDERAPLPEEDDLPGSRLGIEAGELDRRADGSRPAHAPRPHPDGRREGKAGGPKGLETHYRTFAAGSPINE